MWLLRWKLKILEEVNIDALHPSLQSDSYSLFESSSVMFIQHEPELLGNVKKHDHLMLLCIECLI